MIGPSKILTVSYGTFSCTLEGFDDPFNTMKAIAEYFRDLAAGDRYFGATPPTPDAEMLHRIAEREIHRRVEARVDDRGIVLRAADEPAAVPPPLPATETSAAALATAAVAAPVAARAAEPEPAPAADLADRPEADFAGDAILAPALPATAPAGVGTPAPAADHDSSDVAAKLSRIRAVIAAAQAAKAAPIPVTAFEEDEEILDAAPAAFAPAFDDEPDSGEFEAVAAGDDDFGFALELDDLTATQPAGPADVAAEPPAGVEYLAQELAEDLAVAAIAEPAQERDDEAAAAWDEEEPEAAAAAGLVAAEAAEDIAEEPAGDPAADAMQAWSESDEAMDDEDYTALTVTALIGTQSAPAPEAEARVAEDLPAPVEAEAPGALDLSGWRVDETAAEDEAAGDALDESADEGLAAPRAEAEIAPEEAESTDAVIGEAIAAAPAERHPGFFERARARVISIRRGAAPAVESEAAEAPEADAETIPAPAAEAVEAAAESAADTIAAEAAETEDDVRHAAIFAALHDTEEADEEADFEEEFAETTAEAEVGEADEDEDDEGAILAGIGDAIGASDDDTADDEATLRDLSDLAREVRRDAHEGRAILEDQASDDEASVERLMEEAKSKLEGDESRRRFSAIAHLKAAVAATVADRKLKSHDLAAGDVAPAEDIDRYRDDLSKAVRPRRPTTEGVTATQRPALSGRPAPLMLVSEQRVDVEEDAVKPGAAIRPRRIGAAALSLGEAEDDLADEEPLSPEEAKSFAEFADRLGAANLAELLEAAAAYTATVEGLPHFSRPHILKKVSGFADDEEFTREDGLRSFGMLLRQGKIQKISRGQFMITEASRFMSDARRAAR